MEKFSRLRLVVELRNRDWMTGEQKGETVSFFKRAKTTLVTVDAPESEHFTVMPFSEEITNPELAYWRFHGRDERAYVQGRTVADRFDYDYSEPELEDIASGAADEPKREGTAPGVQQQSLALRTESGGEAAADPRSKAGGDRRRVRKTDGLAT